jgi:hypothetical protein
MNFANVSLPPTPSPDAITALLQLFSLVSDPAKHKALLDELTKVRDEAQTAVAEFEALDAKRAALDAERDVIRVLAKAHTDRLNAIEAKLATDRAAHQTAVDEHASAVEKHKQSVTEFEREKAAHANRLAEVDRLKQAIAA